MMGTVTADTVDEGKKEAIIGVTDGAGRSHLIRSPMSGADLAEYAQFRDAYFGRVLPGPTFFVAFVHVRSHPFTGFLWSICGPFAISSGHW
jgi:hypothetical protein